MYRFLSRQSKLIFIFPLTSVTLSLFIWTFIPIRLFTPDYNGINNHGLDNNYEYLNHTGDWIFGDFIIRNSGRCPQFGLATIVLLIHSDPVNIESRNLLRHYTPGNYCFTFLLGSRDNATNQQIAKESKQFGDIVQGTFLDSYRNLTRKHIMGLTWAALYCPLASFILKMDDDVLLNYTFISDYLDSQFPSYSMDPFLVRTPIKMIIGYVMPRSPVIRDKTSKWYVDSSEYGDDFYPTFVSGWGYITSIDVIHLLLNQIKDTPMFWIDDIYVTGMLRSKLTDIYFYSINQFFNINLDTVRNWTRLKHNHVWPYMVSVSSKDLLSISLERYSYCDKHKKHCDCCLTWLDPFDKKKTEPMERSDLVPLKSAGEIAELHIR
ncbi:beta-1,3-galactosyltransferase 1-like [Tetranychus urticae]|uniref:Hexosyltransferase n=1 Tax=Tetranychus urticae TaxID=32264 RepID=T1L0Q2_TETUR|nr:beta-1,3-galactosyltransferase 1-like [Tetranychus urticae]